MPYINKKTKRFIKDSIHAIVSTSRVEDFQTKEIGSAIINPGELNYIITETILGYLDHKISQDNRNIQYHDLNEIMGVLESCKLEFYRRIATPYEDKKIKENGDVY